MDAFFLSRKELLGLFVPGSPLGILNEAYANTIGLVNGADVVMEKLYFDDGDEDTMKQLERVDGFKIINLKFKRPLGMIVTLPNANQSLFKFGLDENKFSVPIPLKSTTSDLKWRKKKIIFKKLGVDYAAAITTYKVQGATLTLGIMDLNHPSQNLKELTIQDVYVAISRFTSMNDFRISQMLENDNLQHLTNLRWPAHLKYFYDCIKNPEGRFNASKYLSPDTAPHEVLLRKAELATLMKNFWNMFRVVLVQISLRKLRSGQFCISTTFRALLTKRKTNCWLSLKN